MKFLIGALLALLICGLALTACDEATAPTDSNSPTSDLGAEPTAAAVNTLGANETPFDTSQTPPPLPTPQATYCKNGGAISVIGNEPLAAKVNGQPIPRSLYERQVAQAQAALVAQGLDPNTQTGKDTIKGLQQQVLGQLIDNLVVEQSAQQENIAITNQDVDSRIQQLVDDAQGLDKFNDYLKSNNIQLEDLCMQIRASVVGDIMLNRVTAALPTKVEQVHAAHILSSTQADANKVLAQVKANKDFASLAKQFSKDESSRDNGGDLGWFPKGVMPPEFEAAAFQLQPGQTSGVVSTALGFDIIKVLERDPAHPLAPDMLQVQKQRAFLAWLDARRAQSKIEKIVNP